VTAHLGYQIMVYLGPIQARLASIKVPDRLVAPSPVDAYARDMYPENPSAIIQSHSPHKVICERRKGDRRKNLNSPLSETRAGKDRRKSTASLDISV
jgi:hypothetical protein